MLSNVEGPTSLRQSQTPGNRGTELRTYDDERRLSTRTDVGGNTIPNYSGDAILTANTGAGSISPELITFANGLWSGATTFRGAGGSVTLTCSDFSSPPHIGTSNSFTVLPAASQLMFLQQPTNVASGSTMSPAVTIQILDSLGHVATTNTSSVTPASGCSESATTRRCLPV